MKTRVLCEEGEGEEGAGVWEENDVDFRNVNWRLPWNPKDWRGVNQQVTVQLNQLLAKNNSEVNSNLNGAFNV